jgi:hypothetical protein
MLKEPDHALHGRKARSSLSQMMRKDTGGDIPLLWDLEAQPHGGEAQQWRALERMRLALTAPRLPFSIYFFAA